MKRQKWLVLGIACSATLAIWLGSLIASGQAAHCPGTCDAGFLSSREYLGGIECEHGPEYDSDCGNPPDCCEIKPGGCTGAANECNCFTCGNDPNCEAEFRTWICGCGRTSEQGFTQPAPPAGTCDECQTDPGQANEVLDEGRDMDGPCDPGENFWMLWVFYCGGPSFTANCLAIDDSGCVYAPGSAWVKQAPDGPRPYCHKKS